MTEASRDLIAQITRTESGPDYLRYYKFLVSELLSEEDDFLLPFSRSDYESVGGSSKEKLNGFGSPLLFSGGLTDGISDFKLERLKGFLNETIVSLNQGTDEILDSILVKCQIEASLMKHEDMRKCDQKLKASNSPLHSDFSLDIPYKESSKSCREVYADFQGLIKGGSLPEDTIERCSNVIFAKLSQMEQNLEEYLDVVMSKCRQMTHAEKQQLGQKIQKLPAKALDRVVEIIKSRKDSARHPSDNIININLEEEDDVTLWRLYCYVETVLKANTL